MTPYDAECIVLGCILKFGDEAYKIVATLDHNDFIGSMSGEFGGDHSHLWKKIQQTTLPYLEQVAPKLKEDMQTYARSLVDRLHSRYFVDELDVKRLLALKETLQRNAAAYKASLFASQMGSNIVDMTTFSDKMCGIPDVNAWINNQLVHFRDLAAPQKSDYTHVSRITGPVRENWQRMVEGEQLVILPCGMPSLVKAQLLPIHKTAVLHGLSGSGKSSFAFQYALGVAIGLVAHKTSGCVAITSLEEPKFDVMERFAAILSGIDVSRFLGGKEPITPDEHRCLNQWLDVVEKLPIYIDDTNLETTSAMQFKVSGLNATKNGPVRLLITDYNGLFMDNDGDTKEQRIHNIFRNQLAISRLLGCAVLAISQSTPPPESGQTRIAGALGVRHSKGVGHNADIMIEMANFPEIKLSHIKVNPPQEYNDGRAHLLVEKYRKGSKGDIPFGWHPQRTTFLDLELCRGATPGQEPVFDHLPQALENLNMDMPQLHGQGGAW